LKQISNLSKKRDTNLSLGAVQLSKTRLVGKRGKTNDAEIMIEITKGKKTVFGVAWDERIQGFLG